MKIIIHEEKDHAWCEVFGRFIYGNSVKDVKDALDIAYDMNFFETEIK